MNKNNNFFKVGSILGASIILVACGTDTEDSYPDKPIELIVGFAAGAGTDINARELVPHLEDSLDGANIQVINRPGAGGWVGWDELLSAEGDGYTIGYLNTPNLFTGWLNPEMSRNASLDDFTLIANHLTDPGIISIHPDETRFSDLESLIEYAQENPITVTSTAIGGYQHSVALEMNRDHGTNFEPVHNEGAAESMSQFLGRHVDILINSVGQAYQPIENGEIIPLVVLAEERSEFLEEIPVSEETVIGSITGGASRGIGAPGDFPDELVPQLADALEAAMTSEEHVESMAEQGLAINFLGPDEFRTHLEDEQAILEDLVEDLGWSE